MPLHTNANAYGNGNASLGTSSAYSKVVAIAKAAGVADARWVQAMKNILWSIPNANYNCLRRVLACRGKPWCGLGWCDVQDLRSTNLTRETRPT